MNTHTPVGIVGAGPAGLLLSHLLHLQGIDSVIIERRSRAAIEATIRAGVLEQGTVDTMIEAGLGVRLQREGAVHHGFDLRFGGASHRIDLTGLTGRAITVYPQHEVLKDLIAARLAADGQIVFEASDVTVRDVTTDPHIHYTDAEGIQHDLACDLLVGADGSHGVCRAAIPEGLRKDYFRVYPFGWFGILCNAPPSHHELIYARSPTGFALISTRNPGVQRMYFQCDPNENADDWSQEQIWERLQSNVAGEDGFRLIEGEIFQKGVIPMRSFACEPMQYGKMFLAGDAAHSVPPTGAKGLNLAANDVVLLARAMEKHFKQHDDALLESYTTTALKRVWRAQHFSWLMTSMMHNAPDENDFDSKRQLAELELLTSSPDAARTLATIYAGPPLGT
jgi:p-hydroxybenzoate 3-monooxygenase